MQTIHTLSYCQRRGELKTYFDRTASDAWKQLTSDAPVSRIRATVRAGRNEMRKTLLDWLPGDLYGKRILDAGAKVLSESPPPPGADGYGAVVGRPELLLEALSEEHGHCRLPAGGESLAVGDRVEVIPNHACTCVNHQRVLYGVRSGRVVAPMRPLLRGALG